MIEYIKQNLGMIIEWGTLLIILTGIVLHREKKFEKHFDKADKKFEAMEVRLDGICKRIDDAYSMIMLHLGGEKK